MTRLRAQHAFGGLCALAALCSGSVRAQDSTNSPYFVGLSQTFTHESNALRLVDGQTAPTDFSRSDNVSSTALLAGFDQSFGRQRGYANVALRENRYSRNSVFSNRSYNASGGLQWSTIERISGTLTASANRSLQRFNTAEVSLITEKNLETVESVGGTVNVGLVTKYSFDLGYNRREVHNSLERPQVQARAYNQDAANAGLRWTPSSGLSTSLGVASTQGRYPKFRTAGNGEYEADRFKRNDIVITSTYRPGGSSEFNLRLSHGKTHYDLNEQRDFSGTTGSLNWIWQPTGKLRFTTSASRDTGQDSYSTAFTVFPGFPPILATTDYSRVVENYRVAAYYLATAKIAVTASVIQSNRALVRTTDNDAFADARGKERRTATALGVRWTPLNAVSGGCDYSNERQGGSGALFTPLHNTAFSCFAQITLQ